MGQCLAAELVDRGVIEVAGAEARRLLQGLVTNDIETARDGRAIFAGLLTPQGKILFDFFLVPKGDGFLVEAPKASLGELLKRLNFYRLRAAVEIKEAPLKGVACWGGEPKVVCDVTPPFGGGTEVGNTAHASQPEEPEPPGRCPLAEFIPLHCT